MGIMKKYFNHDSYHQYIVNGDELIAVNISFDKDIIKDSMLRLLQYDNNSNCLLMSDVELKKYNFPINMYCIGNFSFGKNKEVTVNYLVPNNKLLFLLNYFYQKIEKGISLNNYDLNELYTLESSVVASKKENEVKLIQELKESIGFRVKNIYNHKGVESITFESINALVQENLPVNVLNVSGILGNAIDNTTILSKLNIDFDLGLQKVKA